MEDDFVGDYRRVGRVNVWSDIPRSDKGPPLAASRVKLDIASRLRANPGPRAIFRAQTVTERNSPPMELDARSSRDSHRLNPALSAAENRVWRSGCGGGGVVVEKQWRRWNTSHHKLEATTSLLGSYHQGLKYTIFYHYSHTVLEATSDQ